VSASVRSVSWRLESSTHPDNHYGRLTLTFDDKVASFYVKNDEAFRLSALLEAATKAAYRAGINDATRAVDALYPF
jgi:hypothetical protein